ncbi:MAG: VapC toxin family PIN domain ribonuclease, partial [Gammaproteobacteria bacterium]
GLPIGPMDTLIAGSALAIGANLVTHNTTEFRRVPKLRLVDWYG